MKISLEWLNEFIDVKNKKPELFAQEIAEHCFEVEKILNGSENSPKFSNVFAAKVVEWEKHPNADRLRIVKLDLGARIIEPVVCGANNFESGDIVALALPGAVIPQDVHTGSKEAFTLGSAKIRGVESQGMICSAFELALADRPEELPEILILPKSTPVGTDLTEFYSRQEKSSDPVFDFALPANRPDLYSHLGIARELAGILGLKTSKQFLALQDLKSAQKITTLKKAPGFGIDIEEKIDVPFYLGSKLKVKIGPSPDFIVKRLNALGLRSINNVVDITNYVMYELGEPLHAFDAGKVEGKIVVRKARSDEKVITIDHKERQLDPNILVIADQKKVLAVAGIMGGTASEVNEGTEEIILEAANFAPAQIRRASRMLGLRTDGSGFWEKGLLPEQAVLGAARAIELMQKHASAEILGLVQAGALKSKEQKINFNLEQINSLLGVDYNIAQLKKLFVRLGWKVSGTTKLSAGIPSYRSDVYNYADLADELIKITGMNLLEKRPLRLMRKNLQIDESLSTHLLKEEMIRLGLNEVQSYSFLSATEALEQGGTVKIKNPLSGDQAFMRQNLFISLLKVVSLNAKNLDEIKIFEIGKGYFGYLKEKDLLAFALYNKYLNPAALVAEAKGIIENLVEGAVYTNAKNTLEVSLNNNGKRKQLGLIAFTNQGDLNKYSLEKNVLICELEVAPLLAARAEKKYKVFSKYPEKTLDISIVVEKNQKIDVIENTIRNTGGALLKSIDLFEANYLYPIGKIPKFHKDLAEKDQRNLAFHLVFGAENRTLTDSEIMPIYDKIKVELTDKFQAEIR